MTNVATVQVDCHAYAWHLVNEAYPECGPDNLTRMSEQYGVLVKFLPDHDWAGWADWYEITGPPAHIIALMEAEYGDAVFDLEELEAIAAGQAGQFRRETEARQA